MSDINLLLGHAKEKIHSAIALVQTKMAQTDLYINSDYEWDGGDGLLAFDGQGAGTEQLSQSMAGLAGLLHDNPELLKEPYTITPEVREYLEGIANARGIAMDQAAQDYKRFLDLMNEAEIEIEPTDEYGTLAHLRFGYVAGEALGIDAAFASLMSAYGGLTGPGKRAANIDGNGIVEEIGGLFISNEALAYHAATHDALGFLKDKFDIGPGYCYVPEGADCIADNGLGGQLSGITHWEDKLGVSSPLGDVIRATEPIRDVISEGAEAVGEVSGELREAGREISSEWSEAGGEILREAREGDVAGVVLETGEGLAETAWQTAEGTLETGWEVVEGGLETGWETVKGDGVPFVPGI